MMETQLILVLAIIAIFIAFALFVWGFVPEKIEEDEIFGYRLTKRKRLLEENELYALILPMVKLFAHYMRILPDKFLIFNIREFREDLSDKLKKSGYIGAFIPNEFLGMCCVVAVGTTIFMLLFTLMIGEAPNIGLSILAGFISLALPYIQLNSTISERLLELDLRLPYTVDLLLLSMRAGLDFMTAVDRVVERGQQQNPDDPMIQELGVVLQEMRVGTARSDALLNLCARVNSDYLDTMVGAILQSEKRGTPLVKVLEIQVKTIRNKRTAKIEKAASQAAVKILLPLMFIFGAVVLVVVGAMTLQVMGEGTF